MGRNKKVLSLDVYMNGAAVGVLLKAPTGALSFRYHKEWVDNPEYFPISSSLPLQYEDFKGQEVLAFFDNLLPDNDKIRHKVAEKVGTESSEAFDLLYAIGGDCVGALQLVPTNTRPPDVGLCEGKPLSDTEIGRKIKNLSFEPLGIQEDDDFRLSLAGFQEKTAFLKKNGKWLIPLRSTPTTHIFKPSMGVLQNGIDLSTSVENEYLCLKIAAYLGLETANIEIGNFDDAKCLVVERFDRKWSDDGRRLYRIPQEDMCQALGVSSSKKYESQGGPGILKIMKFLEGSDESGLDRLEFMKAQIVNYLLGATDGHAKNFSIFITPEGYKLTPMYDILSVYPALKSRQIEIKNVKLAMAVGENRKYRIRDIFKRNWLQTAIMCSLPEKEISNMIEEMVSRIEKGLQSQIKLPKSFPEAVCLPIFEGVDKRASNLT